MDLKLQKKRSLDMKMDGLIWFNGNLMGFQWVLLGFNGMSWVLNMEINGILVEMNMDTLFSFFPRFSGCLNVFIGYELIGFFE